MTGREFTGKMALAASRYGKERDYWLDKLSGEPIKTSFPYDNELTPKEYRLETVNLHLDDSLSEKLIKLGKQSNYMVHIILAAAASALLARYTAQNDILMGIPIYNQEKEGEYLNTALVIRMQVEDHMTFKQLLAQARQTIIEANQNQNYPLEILLNQLSLSFTGNSFPLFDTVVLLENIHQKRYIQHTYPNVIFSFLKNQDTLQGKIEYNSSLYHQETLERISRHFTDLLTGALANPDTPVSAIDILSKQEKQQLLWDFNRTQTSYPQYNTIDELFAAQASKSPWQVAVSDEHESMTYDALNQWSLRLGIHLQQQGVKPDDVVGILAENSLAMIAGLLGILKAGAAYLPLNSEYPEERKKMLLQDSNVRILLVTTGENDNYVWNNETEVEILPVQCLEIDAQPGDVKKNHGAGNLAYIIYTSGSTGNPRGVMVQHRSVVRLVKNTNYVEFKKNDRILQTGALDFDASTFEIWGSLLNSLQLHLACKEMILNPRTLAYLIHSRQITTIWMTSALFNHMVDEDIEIFKCLKNLLVGGDVLSPVHIGQVKKAYPRLKVINGYGPTENTTFSVTFTIDRDYSQSIPIGKPIANSTVYILDRQGSPVPIAVPGELCVGGAGLARGYLNNPELTAEKFDYNLWDLWDYQDKKKKVSFKGTRGLAPLLSGKNHMQSCNHAARQPCSQATMQSPLRQSSQYPIPPLPQSPIYHTGDLARWLVDGNIDFLGRIDQQVKIRGYRIEPGEIETQLLTRCKSITEAVVIAEDCGAEKYLCAYVVMAKNRALDVVEIKQVLSANLPDYMIPSYFVQMDKIPLTKNGKIDRKALPEPGIQAGRNYTAPRSAIEKELVETWSDLLGVEKDFIGIDTDFFDLGGHSLKATILISRIHKKMDVKIPLTVLFQGPTIREMAEYIIKQGIKPKKDKFTTVKAVEEKEYYELSSVQRRMMMLQQMNPDGTGYNIFAAFVLQGEVDKEKLPGIFLELIQRHESFRTSFHMIEGKAVQRIHDQVPFEIEYYNMKETEAEFKVEVEESIEEGRVEGWKVRRIEDKEVPFGQINAFGGQYPKSQELRAKGYIHSFIRPFDLACAPLLRVGLIKEENNKYILMVDIHHIVTDGISMGILFMEFMKRYGEEKLPGIRLRYRDFSAWQNQLLACGEIKKQEEYWTKQFVGEIPVLDLAADYPRPAVKSFAGETIRFQLNPEQTRGLKSLASTEGITLFIVLKAIFDIFLSKISSREDVVIGIPIAARRHADLQPIIGMFVNTLVLRSNPAGGKTIKTFLEEVKQNSLEAYENQEYPFEELVEKIAPDRDVSRNPLFDVTFSFHNEIDPEEIKELEIPGLALKLFPYDINRSKFDLDLIAMESENQVQLVLLYYLPLFKKDTVERFVHYYQRIVDAFLENPGTKISGIDIIPLEEKKQLLYDFNETTAAYPRDKTIHQLFAQQVEHTPDYIALVSAPPAHEKYDTNYNMSNLFYRSPGSYMSYISYKELNKKANQLAYLLIEKGVHSDTIVGIMVERSIEMIVGVLAILKAGGAYMPIDPDSPPERIDYMLADSKIEILLIDNTSQPQKCLRRPGALLKNRPWTPQNFLLFPFLPFLSGTQLSMKEEISNAGVLSNIRHATRNSQLAYVIYTSGTTGRPKGTLIEHGNVVSLMFHDNFLYDFNSKDTWTMFHSYCFDFSVWEIFCALLYGGKLIIVPGMTAKDTHKFLELIKRQHVTVLNQVPSAFYQFLDIEMQQETANLHLRYVIFGGEALRTTRLKKWQARYPDTRLINMYGITETTVHVTFKNIAPGDLDQDISNIGKPLPTLVVYVLDRHLKLQPPGIGGEVCIGGAGVARGYLNQPTLTSRKFIQNPYKPGEKLYRSGDLARLLENNDLQYLGRIDNQVKIRGFRIELSEIESRLLTQPGIKNAVVLAREDKKGEKYLCAYIVADKGLTLSDPGKLLSGKLPDYMIPSYFVHLEKIPLTANDKVDHRALPEPGIKIESDYIPPRDEVEKKLAAIWQQVLGIEKIGINDHFFHLGGYSLKAAAVVSNIRKEFNVDIPLVDFFKAPFIKSLAKYIIKAGKTVRKTGNEQLVLLKPGPGSDNHLFFLHDGTGEVDGYIEFCRHLTQPLNYWGVRAQWLEGAAPHEQTIEETAAHYIENLKSLQPRGPYHIVGWSLGGTIAFEMALELERLQEKIGTLVLIDALPPAASPVEKKISFNRKTELDFIRCCLPEETLQQRLKNINEIKGIWTETINYLEENELALKDKIETIKGSIPGLTAIPNAARLSIRQLVQYLNLGRTLDRARSKYIPTRKLEAAVHFFKATETREIDPTKWNNYCQKPIKVYELEGDHYSLLKMPLVKTTAKLFQKIQE